ncbi:eukaryotic translation initiation factor 2A-like [Convolutriloba macropyga]|uniref:eukaryotic translation initiation factor 2A-like n=1 Tax=Convolutriloba macropyga TaxID=536237 RepID=UPI003F527887
MSPIVEGRNGYSLDANALPHLSVRGNEGFFLYSTSALPEQQLAPPIHLDSTLQQKNTNQVFAWSGEGKYLAWCNSEYLVVMNVNNNFAPLFQVNRARVTSIQFSPRNTYICTFEPFSNANGNKDNICIYSFLSQRVVATFTQGTSANWQPQFSQDERICCRFYKEHAVFYQDGDFTQPKHKLHIPGLALVQMFPTAPNHVAVYITGSKKGTPSVVKILRYPDLDQYAALSSKSFFKADKATLHWNSNGTALIVKSMTEVDQSGKAYYGETMLFYVSTDGSSGVVELNKPGPMYDICWDPNKNEFCVVYGHMPSKASLFNSKCSSVYDFGTGLRSACRFSPQGHLLALYGHGAIRSNVEIWHRPTLSLIAKIIDFADITLFEWSPCGERLLLATHSPTLKVDNKWAIYDYQGRRLKEDMGRAGLSAGARGGSNFEFWQVCWQQRNSKEQYPPRELQFSAISLQDLQVQEATEKKYVPPHLRNKAQAEKRNIVLDLNDLPENERAAALAKNGGDKGGHSVTYRSGGGGGGGATQTSGMGSYSANSSSHVVGAAPAGDTTSEKSKKNRIKTLEKRMKEIGALKRKQKSGEKLEAEAVNKINREEEVRSEMNKLKQELGMPTASTGTPTPTQ